ncbi:MAG: RluA family pseudouridine synthase [Clostridia bacterium]|nr:RluA family pseudouridine synthase [Clostridia bacterium]
MIDIVFEDKHLILAVKPVGLSSQDGADSLPAQLAEQGLPVKTVHRLDKQTGGVMVYARTGQAAAALCALVGQHEVFVKDYLAVVQGTPTPAEGTLEDLLYHDVRKNKSYIVTRSRKGVREASLSYRVLSTKDTPEGVYSLVRVRLHTGRTHQIRVQFAGRKMPLWGDSRYGGNRQAGPALWSVRLTFPHPITGETVCGESTPDWTAAPWSYFAVNGSQPQ